MSAIPPIKPPRGIKPTKETVNEFVQVQNIFSLKFYYQQNNVNVHNESNLQSGLLISVIRALSASETNEQREIEKAKLEKEYKRSDQRLDELVSLHDQDLTEVMQVNLHTFVYISRHRNTFGNLAKLPRK